MAGKDNSGFFTPHFEPSPFAAVDNETTPHFAVGVFIGKFTGGGQGAGSAVHMYVDEQPEIREVQLVSPHTLTGGMRSGRLVRKFFEEFRSADPALTILDGNVDPAAERKLSNGDLRPSGEARSSPAVYGFTAVFISAPISLALSARL